MAGKKIIDTYLPLSPTEVPATWQGYDGTCPNCGWHMYGDGYTQPLTCEWAVVPIDAEPDSGPWYCEDDAA